MTLWLLLLNVVAWLLAGPPLLLVQLASRHRREPLPNTTLDAVRLPSRAEVESTSCPHPCPT